MSLGSQVSGARQRKTQGLRGRHRAVPGGEAHEGAGGAASLLGFQGWFHVDLFERGVDRGGGECEVGGSGCPRLGQIRDA
eukprot:2433342-Pyramimonas_sp.AAC.1